MALDVMLSNFSPMDLAGVGALVTLFAAFIALGMTFLFGVYVYLSFAFMEIAKKTKYRPEGMAWVPVIGPSLIAANASKMHWWPLLLLIGAFMSSASGLFALAFIVFLTLWMWKTYEKLGRPGWWALLGLLPFVGLPLFMILVGITAWGKK